MMDRLMDGTQKAVAGLFPVYLFEKNGEYLSRASRLLFSENWFGDRNEDLLYTYCGSFQAQTTQAVP